MDSEQKDFKAVKVQLKATQRQEGALSRSMLYSGINIFGQLSQIYLQNKESGGSYSAFTTQTSSKPSSQMDMGDGASMMNISQDVLQIFKRLQKKDPTTKIKAFQDLNVYLEQIQVLKEGDDTTVDEINNLLTFFLYHFCRILINEPDKKVREAAHQSLSVFIKKAKRKLGPHLKRIFSLWYCSFYDQSQEVALLARKNFEFAFPEQKRDQVFKLAYKNFLHFANEQLKQSEDAITDSNADLSKAQREDVFDRITSCVLLALAGSFEFIKNWNEEEKEHFKKKLIDILDLSQPLPIAEEKQEVKQEEAKGKKQQQEKKKAVPQSYLWGFLQSKYRGRVRSSCLQFISNLLLNLPKEIIESHIQQLSPLIYGLVGEDNSSLQTTLWREAIFTLGKNFPNSWEGVNIKKNFLPSLYKSLKASGFGSPTALYENLVKFVSIFPFYHLVDYTEDKVNKASFKERCNLIRELFVNQYAGLKNDESVAFHQDLVKSYYESLTFVIWKRVQPLIQNDKVSNEDKDFALQHLKKCIQLPLEDYINNFEKFISKVQNQRNIRIMIPIHNAKMMKDLAERNVDKRIYDTICDFINESILLTIDKSNTLKPLEQMFRITIETENQQYYDLIIKGIIGNYQKVLTDQVHQDIENLSKDNVDLVVRKTFNLNKLVYRLNKHQIRNENLLTNPEQQTGILFKLLKKEEMAKNVLTQEILNKFKTIKEQLIKSIILNFNLHPESFLQSFIKQILEQPSLEQNNKLSVLFPLNTIKKIDFARYFEGLTRSEVHSQILDYIISAIIKNDGNLTSYHQFIHQGLSFLLDNKPSYLITSDLSTISSTILESIKQVRPDALINQYLFIAVQSLINQRDTDAYNELKFILFERLLKIKSNNPIFKPLWNIYAQAIKLHLQGQQKDHTYYDYCLSKLKEELKNIIHQNTNYDVDSFNRFTMIVKQFVQLGTDKQLIVENILLQEDNFSNLDNNALPIKMFRDLFLSGGVGFDVTKLLSNKEYVWLASILLNTRHLPSLANFIQLKKQLLIFVDTEILPALINQAQNGNIELINEIFRYLRERASENMDYVYTIEFLMKKMIDPGEDFPADEKPVLKISEFKDIFMSINKNVIDQISSSEKIDYSNEVLIFIKILRQIAYFIIDEKTITDIFQKSYSIIKQHLSSGKQSFDQQFAIALEIYQSLYEYLGQTLSDDINNDLLISQLKNSQQLTDDTNVLNASLEFTSYIVNKLGVFQFIQAIQDKINFQTFISQIIEVQQNKHLSPLTQIHLLSIIRKTIGSDLIKDKQLLIHQVIDIAKHNALSFDLKIQKIQENLARELKGDQEEQKNEAGDESFEEDQIEDFEYEMLQEIAETLIMFPSYINPSLNENDLYILMSSGVESLQKAAFILLKYLYENYIPTLAYQIADEEMEKQVIMEAKQQQLNEGEEESKVVDTQKYKNKLAFRNISEILIEIIENPPNLHHDEKDQQQQIVSGSTQTESLIFGDSQEGTINSKVFGYFLAWNAMLIKIENGRIKSSLQQIQDYSTVLGALNEYLEENDSIYRMLLVSLIAYLPEEKRGLYEVYNVSRFEPEYMEIQDKRQNSFFVVYTLINFMKSFPSLARKYYQECEKQLLDLVMPYIKQVVSPAILENEIKKIEVAQSQMGSSELSFALFKSTKEILASFKKGEIEMTLKIKIPADYPLKLVEVDVSKQIKISEKQMRKWILAIRKIIQFQNGDIISAVLVWKRNIEKEIEGIEDCYICYCVVHEGDQSLPKMPCKTCKNKFHVACIRKWFRQSHKSNCPICQNYFF